MKAYCIFCRTGQENTIARAINRLDDNIEAISPVRVLQEKREGKWVFCEKPLVPGYIFVYSEDSLPYGQIKTQQGVYKILEYQTGKRELVDSDYEYAMWIFDHGGKIKPSRALIEGDVIKVIDGPLVDGIGSIIKLDRHKRRALVEFDFYGKKHKVSLSVIDITSLQN